MERNEIKELLLKCKTQEGIREFVNMRLSELEADSVETIMGQGYTDTFRDFISSKVHYKTTAKIGGQDSPDLVYDDESPYFSLVENISNAGGYNFVSVFDNIFRLLYEYLPSHDDSGIDRYMLYNGGVKDGKVSIKDIKENACAFCSEKSGLAHNLLKFLGIDSELVCGTRGKELHAYNIVYPNGYDKQPAVIYDPSHHIDYINAEGKKYSFGFFCPLNENEHKKLLEEKSIEIDTQSSASKIEATYGWNGALNDFEIVTEKIAYGIGLNKTRNIRSIMANNDKSDPRD